MNLPHNLKALITYQNDSDSTAFADCFTEQATVSDEGSTYTGRTAIKQWIQKATETYTMQVKPLGFTQSGSNAVLTVDVTGTFPGSPLRMQYHLVLDGHLIRTLKITG